MDKIGIALFLCFFPVIVLAPGLSIWQYSPFKEGKIHGQKKEREGEGELQESKRVREGKTGRRGEGEEQRKGK
jgi:hypothetical protein